METEIQSLKEQILNRKEILEPVICIIGEDVENIQKAYGYVIVDDQQYKVPTYLDTVALTFKIFYSLNWTYPKSSLRLFQFVQHVGYDISLNEPNINSVKKFLGLTNKAFKEAIVFSTFFDQQWLFESSVKEPLKIILTWYHTWN